MAVPAFVRKSRTADFAAGLVAGLIGVPQAIAYALLAGAGAAQGLAAGAVGGFTSAVVGRNPTIATGPTNTTSLLVLPVLMSYAAGDPALADSQGLGALTALATLTVLAGVWRLLGAAGGADRWLRFIPESVLVGFGAGAAVLIAATQVDEALGLPANRASTLTELVTGIVQHLAAGTSVSPVALSLTLAGAFLLRWRRHFLGLPMPLWLLIVGPLTGPIADLCGSPLATLGQTATLPSGWPAIHLPPIAPAALWAATQQLALPALALALLGTLELAVASRHYRAEGTFAPTSIRRELLAQGAANVASALVGGIPCSASLSRTALIAQNRPKGRTALVVSALTGGVLLLSAGPLLAVVPLWVLAAVLWATALGMVDGPRVRRMWHTSSKTRLLLCLTFALAISVPIHFAILAGAGLGLLMHLADSSTPRLQSLVRRGDRLEPLAPYADSDHVIVEVSGELHFAAVPTFLAELPALVPTSATLVIVDLSHAHDLRFAALEALENLAGHFRSQGRAMHLAGVHPDLQAMLLRAQSQLPFTPASPVPGASALGAVDAAQAIKTRGNTA